MEKYLMIFGIVLMLSCNLKKEELDNSDLTQLISEFESIRESDDDLDWPEFDQNKINVQLSGYEKIQSKLNKIKAADLEISDQINLDMLNLVVEDEKAQLEFEQHLMPLNSEGGFLAGIVYTIRDSKVTNQEEFLKYKVKVNDLPAIWKSA